MNRRNILIGSVSVLVVLLGAAAFLGGRLLNENGLSLPWSSSSPNVSIAYGGHSISLQIQPSRELPSTAAIVKGAFDHRQNNSLFVGTGSQVSAPQSSQGGSVSNSSSFSGPTYEVVVTSQTSVYRDVTLDQYNGTLRNGQKLQQVLEAGSIDEIGQDSEITVWGQKTGARVIASVLVYTLPAVLNP